MIKLHALVFLLASKGFAQSGKSKWWKHGEIGGVFWSQGLLDSYAISPVFRWTPTIRIKKKFALQIEAETLVVPSALDNSISPVVGSGLNLFFVARDRHYFGLGTGVQFPFQGQLDGGLSSTMALFGQVKFTVAFQKRRLWIIDKISVSYRFLESRELNDTFNQQLFFSIGLGR